MTLTTQEVEQATDFIVNQIGDAYEWSWDDHKNMRFTKFASNRTEPVLKVLRKNFPHQWDKKSIKKAPQALKEQLGSLAKLDKMQVLYTSPANDERPMLVAAWWPWEHGGTVSVRLIALDSQYEISETKPERDSFFTVFKKLFS